MKSEWDRLVGGIKGVDVTTRSEVKSTTITVCGQIDKVDEMWEVLLLLQKKVMKKDVYPPLHTTGFNEYEKSREWEIFLSGAEYLDKVCIAVLKSEGFPESGVIPVEVAEVRDDSNTIMLSSIPPDGKYDEEANVYVNSTNTNLNLSGGVISKHLADAAGHSLQDECTRKAPINPGQVAVTGSGNIKYFI
ncbi:hypothetical protein EMCRGX_G031100 [Ephydatia muelleri]|eukprot:Em0018g901a